MQVTGRLEDYNVNFQNNSSKIVLTINSNEVNTLEKLRGLKLNVELKQYREKRRIDANAYCWVLCDNIAKALTTEQTAITKEDIYKDAILQIGRFEPLIITEKAYENFKRIWEKQGLGYLIQEVSKKDKCVRLNAYYGSSSYDTKEMSLLIQILIELAKSIGVETRPKAEIESLLKEWK